MFMQYCPSKRVTAMSKTQIYNISGFILKLESTEFSTFSLMSSSLSKLILIIEISYTSSLAITSQKITVMWPSDLLHVANLRS